MGIPRHLKCEEKKIECHQHTNSNRIIQTGDIELTIVSSTNTYLLIKISLQIREILVLYRKNHIKCTSNPMNGTARR